MRVCDHSFAPALIRPGDVVLDCGANRGDFSRWCSDHLPCRIIAFEPDPRLQPALPALPRVEYVGAAVSHAEGVLPLALGVKSCSSAVLREGRPQQTVDVPSVTLDGFCARHGLAGPIGMIKLDIEGSELDVLERAPVDLLARTRQITVEFHDFLNAADLPRIRAVAARLQACGFHMVRFTYYTWGDCLFLNERMAPLGMWTKITIHVRDKYVAGIRRHLAVRRAHTRCLSNRR